MILYSKENLMKTMGSKKRAATKSAASGVRKSSDNKFLAKAKKFRSSATAKGMATRSASAGVRKASDNKFMKRVRAYKK